ncbi:MAG: TerB family tellurite resistance protein [Gammaproteobacteria bacterium]|nr:TerB family tellurite resistance protein [Gammaproteobacteria bacterium]NNF49898.1 TerB family tellurite resistance protein [Woeseiaceae bacterium]
MLRRLMDRVAEAIATTDDEPAQIEGRDEAIRMATAVLMIDVARADHVFEEAEFERLLQLFESHFDLTPDDAALLVDEAGEKADDLVSAYDFTKILHEHLDHDEKARVVELLWKIAYADGRLDKYENSLVLKISDLLHVSRGRVMRLKHDAGNHAT